MGYAESGRIWSTCSTGRFVRAFLCLVLSRCSANAWAQQSSQPDTSAKPPVVEQKESSAEIVSQDKPTTFKVNVKLVVVRAVVRDELGHAVGNLRKEDFQVFDKGKSQVITQFEVETPGEVAAKVRQRLAEDSNNPLEASSSGSDSFAVPERYIAYVFDDVHLIFGDLAQVRLAAERHMATLKPTDRAAIFTTSGVMPLDFTDDRAQLHEALNRLQPRPIVGSGGTSSQDCPPVISYYEADLIVNKNDPQAGQVAFAEALACEAEMGMSTTGMTASAAINAARATVTSLSAQALSEGEHESHVSLGTLANIVNRISRMPGQRSVVLVSPGFIIPDLQYEYDQIVDRAVRAEVVINTLDARGLYVPAPFADASRRSIGITGVGVTALGNKALLENAAQNAQDDLLATLANSTGGFFFHNNNDFDEGFRRVSDTPEYSYVLAFVPQNLKLDGSFHSLTVKLNGARKLTLQARRGYYAPKNYASPEEQAKHEIEDEMFSQEELHQLPVRLHTQFFKTNDTDAKLVVLAHVDVQHLHFRKTEGRNNNVLTCVSALFNRDGSFVQGTEKVVTMHWKDETLEHKLASGITLKTSFDVKPGSYLVRLVVRDSEAQMMSAENGAVEIR
jgi:VWFA-related protein